MAEKAQKIQGMNLLLASSAFQNHQMSKGFKGISSNIASLKGDLKNLEKTNAKAHTEQLKVQNAQLDIQKKQLAQQEMQTALIRAEQQQKALQLKAKDFVFQLRQELSLISSIASNFERTIALESFREKLAEVEFSTLLLPDMADKEYHQESLSMLMQASADALRALSADELTRLQVLSDNTQAIQDLAELEDFCSIWQEEETRLMKLDAEDFLVKVNDVLHKLPEAEQKLLIKKIKNKKPFFKAGKLTGGKLLLLTILWTIFASGILGATKDSYPLISDVAAYSVMLCWLYVYWVGLKWVWRKIRKTTPKNKDSSSAKPTPSDVQIGARQELIAMARGNWLKKAVSTTDIPTEIQNALELNGDSNPSLERLKSSIDSMRVDLEAAIARNLSGNAEALPNSA